MAVFGALNVLCNTAGGSTTVDAAVTEAAEADDIAHLAVHLASAESRTVTVQVLAVDSGISRR